MEAPRRIALATPLAAMFVIGLHLAPATATPNSAKTPAASQNLIANGNFARGLRNWRGRGARLRTIARARAGHGVRVIARRHGPAAILPTQRPVRRTTAHELYTAGAWVRTRGRQPVCLRLTEVSHGRLLHRTTSCARRARSWTHLRLRYRARRDRSAVDLSLFRRRGSFEVARVTVRRLFRSCRPPHCNPPPPPPGSADRWYSSDSPFNQPIAPGTPADPNSSTMVQSLVAGAPHGFAVAARRWSFPVYYSSPETPRRSVSLTASWAPAHTMAGVPIPATAGPDPAADGHLVVIDAGSGCEYDFWQAQKHSDGSWSAGWGNSTYVTGNGIYAGGLAARASGFASGLGLIRPEELASGTIPHALSFAYPYTKANGPVSPATSSDGTSTAAGAIPEGARIQLDPSLDLNTLGLAPWQKTIASALQTYGMFLADRGGTASLYAQNPQSTGVGYPWGDVDYPQLPTSLLSHMRVLSLPPQTPWHGILVPTACAVLH